MDESSRSDETPRDADIGSTPDPMTSRTLKSADLFVGDGRRVIIRHNGREYVLIATRQGKLVLNRMS